MKKRLVFFTLILILAFAVGCATHQAKEQPMYRVTILHFNDFHGYIAAHRTPEGQRGGIARMAALIESIRKENEAMGVPTLLLFAGDLVQGSPVSTLFHGSQSLRMLGDAGVDLAVMGNHALDYGQENFFSLIGQSPYPWLACNVTRQEPGGATEPILAPGKTLVLQNGLRVGVVGMVTGELVTATNPKNVVGIAADDPVEAAGRHLPDFDAQSDLLIVLSHCGIACDKNMADAYPNVDLIVGGHNHNLYEQPILENRTAIVQAGQYGEHLGRADIRVQGDVGVIESYRLYSITPDLLEDPEIAAEVEAVMAQVDRRGQEVIATATALLDGSREAVRRTESNLGDLVCDLLRERLETDVVLINGGSFRASINPGPIKVADVLAVFPFGNTLVKMRVGGDVIRRAIERGLRDDPMDNPGSFAQVSGATFSIDGTKAVNIKINGAPLDANKTYSLCVNGFMASGGDGFDMLKGIEYATDTGLTLADVVMEAFREAKVIDAATDGRIERIAPWTSPGQSFLIPLFPVQQGQRDYRMAAGF